MKILVFSDSHGYLENMKQAINHFKEIDTIIHLGDFIDDIEEIKDIYKNLKIYAVTGNNDYTNKPNERLINIENNTIFLTHGNKYGVYYGVDKLYYKGIENQANIMLFGHTHKMFLEKEQDYLILNPGSISYPRDSNIPTFAIIEEVEDALSVKFFGIYREGIKEIFL